MWEHEQRNFRMMPESIREGSPLLTLAPLPFMFGVYGVRKGSKTLLGTGWRYGNNLVTAAHVVMDRSFEKVVIQNLVKKSFFETKAWVQLAADVAICDYEQRMELSSAKIDTVSRSANVMVYAARSSQNGSVGLLKHIPSTALGFLEYTGSTLPGFSGAPYFNGVRVLGLHAGGGTVGNYGLSASYIDMLIKSRQRLESSELDMIRRMLKTAKIEDVDYHQGLDETQVRIGGRYVVLDNEEFSQLFDDEEYERYFYDFDQEFDKPRTRKLKKKVVWEEPDYEPETIEDFHEQPPKVLSSEGLDKLNSLENTVISLTQNMQALEARLLSGQKEIETNLAKALEYMQLQEAKCSEALVGQVEQNLKSLWQTSVEAIRFDFDAQLDQMKKDLQSTLTTVSDNVIPQAPQAPATSKQTRPLVMHWDGMDSDLEKFKQWRRSVDLSSPEYTRWREAFLRDGLSLTTEQAGRLIARFQNKATKEKQKLSRKLKTLQEPSSTQ